MLLSSGRSNRSSSDAALATAVLVVCSAAAVWWQRTRQLKQRQERLNAPALPPLSILEFQAAAAQQASKLAQIYVNYFDGQGHTLTAARAFFQNLRLLPSILQGDLTEVDTTLEIFGETLRMPVLIAPTAFHNLTCDEGEIATARGCGQAGAGYSYNWMLSSKPYTDVIKEPGVKWLQMYMFDERDMVAESIRMAERTGAFSAILLTCDHPHVRVQNRMVPSFVQHMTVPKDGAAADEYFCPNQVAAGGSPVTIKKLLSTTAGDDIGSTGTNSYKLSWFDVAWIKSLTDLPVVVKGVLSPADAVAAMQAGAAAIVVSNHGGRQFDGAPPAIEVLPAIVAAVEGGIPVFVDSGIRTATDILKALCLGASGVMLGRPALWALSCGGSDALQRMLDHLRQDLTDDMRSLGVRSIKELNKTFLYAPDRERIEKDVNLVLLKN